MGTVPGKKCPYIPFMRDVALTGTRNPEFKAGFQVLLQQEHTGIRPCGMDRTEKTGRPAPMTAMSYCSTGHLYRSISFDHT